MLPPKLATKTDIIVIVGTALILALDAYLLYSGGEAATISARTAYWSMKAPLVAFLVGVLCGHLFWPNRAYCESETNGTN